MDFVGLRQLAGASGRRKPPEPGRHRRRRRRSAAPASCRASACAAAGTRRSPSARPPAPGRRTANRSTGNRDWPKLAARLFITSLAKSVESYSERIDRLSLRRTTRRPWDSSLETGSPRPIGSPWWAASSIAFARSTPISATRHHRHGEIPPLGRTRLCCTARAEVSA